MKYQLDNPTREFLSRAHVWSGDEMHKSDVGSYTTLFDVKVVAGRYLEELFEETGAEKGPRYKFIPWNINKEEWAEFQNSLDKSREIIDVEGDGVSSSREVKTKNLLDVWKVFVIETITAEGNTPTLCAADDCRRLFTYAGKPAAYCSRACFEKDYERKRYHRDPEAAKKRVRESRRRKNKK